jgi:eukaryotic-like serine/threonine-protein kinase
MGGTREQEPVHQALQHALGERYVLERRLGRGGMGVVYLARELRLERRVAIKLLPPAKAVDRVARERFLREARTAAQLSHPNIVPIFAVEEVADFVFYAMAYVDGQTLGHRIRGRGALTPEEGARVLRQVARALAHAHERGVVHRDVKPDNILLDATSGRALVADFGIARVASASGNTGPREVVGTAEFMSPEQASGQPVDARSDLYSLGVVGYYLLSGRLPFNAPDAYAMLARHVADPAPPLRSVAPAVPRHLARVVDRLLAKDPSARFADGWELAEAIERVAHVRAAPPIAVRAFLREGRHLAGPALVYAALGGLAVPVLAASLRSVEQPGMRALVAAGMAWVLLFPVGLMIARVRRLLAAGYEREDLVETLEAHLARRREELAFLYGEERSGFERTMRRLCHTALGVAAAAVGLESLDQALVAGPLLFAAFGVSALAALLAAIVARARTEHRTDPKAERRVRFWRGPLGRLLFRLAGLGRRRRARDPAEAAAPALDIGLVGDRFFEGRPSSSSGSGNSPLPSSPYRM